MFSQLLGSVITFIIIVGFCFLFYVAADRKSSGFLRYIGAYHANARAVSAAVLLAVPLAAAALFIFYHAGLQNLLLNVNTPAWGLRANGFGPHEVGRVLIYAWLGTALWEEIFFRGFLAKRLILILGFTGGNLAQSVVFGLVHVLLCLAVKVPVPPAAYFAVFLIPALLAYLMVYLNEKMAGGSILPGYVLHALVNTITPLAAAVFF